MAKYDFGGYATRNDVRCADGAVIRKDAFKEQDGKKVPLVWHHVHNDPNNVIGHAILENREDGVYAYGYFNDTANGKQAKAIVEHGDVSALSIFANQLKRQANSVLHGMIREVSLVLAGANPEAYIENISIAHADGTYTDSEEEAIICMQYPLFEEDELEHADGKTVEDVVNSMTEEQRNVMYALIADAVENADELEQSDDLEDPENIEHSNKGGTVVKKNLFDQTAKQVDDAIDTLTHDQLQAIIADTTNYGGSLAKSFLAHAAEYGIENIDILFPDAKTVTPTPEMISRRMEWVPIVINGCRHTPFSRIKSTAADITADEARAKGYVKGNLKKEEVIKLLKRVTTPTTIYKKQKLDRDDIIDITDLDVVAWLKAEMRVMLDEEIARAVLIGDGREIDDEDKINEENIRPIYTDDDMYAHHVTLAANLTPDQMLDAMIQQRKNYKGTGTPDLYTTEDFITSVLLIKDLNQRRIYSTLAEVAAVLRVNRIIPVEVMEGVSRTVGANTLNLAGIMVNLSDYSLGADKGGQVSMFDDFDIDYNQYKYLMETRLSGALIRPKSALVFEQTATAG